MFNRNSTARLLFFLSGGGIIELQLQKQIDKGELFMNIYFAEKIEKPACGEKSIAGKISTVPLSEGFLQSLLSERP